MGQTNPSVTICHKEAYALGGIALAMSLLALLLTITSGEAPLPGFVISAVGLLLSVYGFFKARSVEVLDETGISIQTPFHTVRYPWHQIRRVELHPPGGKDTPKLWLFPEGKSMPLHMEYTKRTYQCILRYYGLPDSDKWGKPPVIT